MKPGDAPASPTPTAAGRSRGLALTLLPFELRAWDAAPQADVLGIFLWSDVRPLRGAAGLLDWRLSGKLSSLIQSGRLGGVEGETLLLPLNGRLPWKVALVTGLGPRAGFAGVRFKAAMDRALAALRGLAVSDVVMALPGRDVDALPARRAVELLLNELRASDEHGWLRRLALIEGPQGHRELAELVRPPAGGAARRPAAR